MKYWAFQFERSSWRRVEKSWDAVVCAYDEVSTVIIIMMNSQLKEDVWFLNSILRRFCCCMECSAISEITEFHWSLISQRVDSVDSIGLQQCCAKCNFIFTLRLTFAECERVSMASSKNFRSSACRRSESLKLFESGTIFMERRERRGDNKIKGGRFTAKRRIRTHEQRQSNKKWRTWPLEETLLLFSYTTSDTTTKKSRNVFVLKRQHGWLR